MARLPSIGKLDMTDHAPIEMPLAETEPPRDCQLCPRLVALREELRAEHPDWWNAPVPAWGDPAAWLAIIGLAPGKHGANRTGRPFTGDYAGDLLFATLSKMGLARGSYGASVADGFSLRWGDHRQRGQMPATPEQADADGDQPVPPVPLRAGGRVAQRPHLRGSRADRP